MALSDLASKFTPPPTAKGQGPKKHYIPFSNEEWTVLTGAFKLTQPTAYKNLLLAVAQGQYDIVPMKRA